LTDPGFDHTVLSEFRTRLLAGRAERLLLDTLLTRLRAQGLLKPRGRQRTDSTHILAAIRVLNRLERVGETLRAALNSLAVVAPAWLQAIAPPEWYDRYSRRVEHYPLPKTEAARKELAAVIGTDGQILLDALDAATEYRWLQEIPAVHTLRQVWGKQYVNVQGRLVWREVHDMPSPAALIASPYDLEARYSIKREIEWVGYQVHVTETCDEDTPHVIVNVAQFIAVCRSVKTSYKMRISVRIFKSRSRPQETLIHADSLTSPSPFQYRRLPSLHPYAAVE
jgi:transposase